MTEPSIYLDIKAEFNARNPEGEQLAQFLNDATEKLGLKTARDIMDSAYCHRATYRMYDRVGKHLSGRAGLTVEKHGDILMVHFDTDNRTHFYDPDGIIWEVEDGNALVVLHQHDPSSRISGLTPRQEVLNAMKSEGVLA